MFQERESKGFQAYDGPIGDFNFESLPVEYATRAIQKFKVLASWRLTFNELEGIAAAFVTGVADEQVGFVILGSGFCHTIRGWYDVLACCRNEKIKIHLPYDNIINLYKIWAPRLKKAELAAQRDMISSQIKSIPDAKIPRLGDTEFGGS